MADGLIIGLAYVMTLIYHEPRIDGKAYFHRRTRFYWQETENIKIKQKNICHSVSDGSHNEKNI